MKEEHFVQRLHSTVLEMIQSTQAALQAKTAQKEERQPSHFTAQKTVGRRPGLMIQCNHFQVRMFVSVPSQGGRAMAHSL